MFSQPHPVFVFFGKITPTKSFETALEIHLFIILLHYRYYTSLYTVTLFRSPQTASSKTP